MTFAVPAAALLLLVGLILRAGVPVLRRLYVPAAVVGGLVGLLFFQLIPHEAEGGLIVPPYGGSEYPFVGVNEWSVELASTFRSWPGALIAVIFAGLLLEPRTERASSIAGGVVRAGLMVWIIILGEIAIGLTVVALLGVPIPFGQLIEAGFAGGHSTAGAYGEMLAGDGFDLPAAFDLGLFMATVGLVGGVLVGIVLVNIGVRRGWTQATSINLAARGGLEHRHNPKPIAYGRVAPDVLDPLALSAIWVALAIGLGVLLQWGVTALIPAGRVSDIVADLPLFLFTLIAGGVLRRLLTAIGYDNLIDAAAVKRIVGVAMEFLIVAAVASLRLESLAEHLGLIAALTVVGFAWTIVCLLVLAPRLLPSEYWFELGLLNFGMSTGTTAQGMMLLRIVDPDLDTPAAEVYALAAPLSAPFIGGGLITFALPALALQFGAGWTALSLGFIVVVLIGMTAAIVRRGG